MGNYIKTTDVVDPNIQQPFTADDLDFWQSLNNKNRLAMMRNIIGEQLYTYGINTGNLIVISGCQKSSSGNTIFNGWIYNCLTLEIFFFPGAMGLNGFTQTPVFFTNEYPDLTIDPVEFTDNVFRNVHLIREVYIVDSAPASGLGDLPNVGRIVPATEVLCTDTSTVSAALTPITLATFTTPNRICDMEITIDASYRIESLASAAAQGGELQLYNFSTSVLLQKKVISIDVGVAGPSGYLIRGSAHVKKVYKAIPANTVIRGNIIRLDTTNVTATNVVMTYKEILPPRLW